MADFRKMKAQEKKRRAKSLLAQSLLAVLAVALVFGNAYCVVKLVHGEAVFALPAARQAGSGGPAAPESGASAPAQPAASGSGQSTAQSGAASASGSTAQAADGRAWNTAARAERTLYSERTAQDARMLSVPENGIVSLEYFRTALFIGDSLTEGFGEYKPLQGIATVYGFLGASPKVFAENGAVSSKGLNLSFPAVWDAISAQQPDSVYVLLGANTLVHAENGDAYLTYYGRFMDMLAERFTSIGVPVYIQGLTPVTEEYSQKHVMLSREQITAMNNELAKMATDRGMYYIDTHDFLADNADYLDAAYAGGDGLHMRDQNAYRVWVEYLARHTVDNRISRNFQTTNEGFAAEMEAIFNPPAQPQA